MGHTIINNPWTTVKKRNSIGGIKPDNKRLKYYDNQTLIVYINGNKYIYPPKAGVILFDKQLEYVLLIKNNYAENNDLAKYSIPKGHLEEKETRSECAEREFYEETGVKINIPQDRQSIRVNNSQYYPFYTDTTKLEKFKPVDINEVSECKFVKIADIKKFNCNQETQNLLTKKLNLARKHAEYIEL